MEISRICNLNSQIPASFPPTLDILVVACDSILRGRLHDVLIRHKAREMKEFGALRQADTIEPKHNPRHTLRIALKLAVVAGIDKITNGLMQDLDIVR